MSKPWLFAILGLGVVAVVVIGIVLFRPGSQPMGLDYYRMLDEDTIVIGLIGGESADARVTDVSETDDTVTITVRLFTTSFGLTNEVGLPVELQVDLERPLGDRKVFDPYHEVLPAESPP